MNEEKPRDNPSDADAETLESQPDQPRRSIPREIGQYKVRRLIGSGGMGTVYEAIQENPKRKVAIKVMKSGATSRSAMRRFEYESEVLGRLSHQAIAKVFEAGKWDDGTGGVPYFAMEYITGAKDIIQYAKTKDLDTTKKLELFTEICDAVHHGHLKGIIHRDLKPDNILVDQTGNPKIIDFGVARATDSDLAVTTLQTNVGQLVGTVQYMSPEQCEADPDLIDSRSDVYSLGVILYELLTGQPPYDLSSIPIYEATRLIREQQPTRMTTVAEGIEGDLETIVGKAMDKDRDRRYQSASELLQDIHRFIENEPIHARRASVAYQLKLFAKRNRGVVATVLTIAVALVLATMVSVYSSIRASQAEAKAIVDRDRAVAAEQAVTSERDRAVAAEKDANDALVIAEEAQKKTQKAMDETREIFQMMISVGEFNKELLALGAPRNAQGKTLSVHDILLVATNEIAERFGHEPNLEAPARASVGTLLWEMGDLEPAREQLARSINLFNSMGNNQRVEEQLQAAIVYAKVMLDLGDHEKAKEVTDKIIETGSQVLEGGSSSPEVLAAQDVLADILTFTLKNPDEMLEIRRNVLAAIDDGAVVSRDFELGARVAFAEALIVREALSGAVEVGPLGREAAELLLELIPQVEEELGNLHPVTIDARITYAGFLAKEYKYDESIPILEEAHRDAVKVYGPLHLKTAEAAGALGTFYMFTGNPKSESSLQESVDIYSSLVDCGNQTLMRCKSMLANLLVGQERYNEAEKLLRENMLEIAGQGEEALLSSINTKGSLSYALLMQGKFDEGLPLWHEVVDFLNQLEAGEATSGLGGMKFIRAMAYIVNGHPDADKVVDEMFADETRIHGKYSQQNLNWWSALSQSYMSVGNVDRAIKLQLDAIEHAREIAISEGKDKLNLYKMEIQLADMYEKSERFDEGRDLISGLIPLLEERLGLYDRLVIASKVLMAKAIFETGRVDEAISMLISLHADLGEQLGFEDDMTKRVEVAWAKSLLQLERWDELDEIMEHRYSRRTDDADLLLEMSDVIIGHDNKGYRERYLDMALKATERAVSIRGEDDPPTTFVLAKVYFARGEYDDALEWCAKTVAFADKDDEDIEMYQTKLREVTTKIKDTVDE